MSIHDHPKANKTDAGNGSKAICRVSNVLRSPSPDPKRSVKKTQAALAISATVTFALPLVLLWRALVNYMQPFEANDPLRVGVFFEQLSGPTLALLMAFSISLLAVMGKRTPLLLPAVGIASAGWGLFFALKFSHIFSHAAFNECSDRFGNLAGSCFALGISLVLAGAILDWRLRRRLDVGGPKNTEQVVAPNGPAATHSHSNLGPNTPVGGL